MRNACGAGKGEWQTLATPKLLIWKTGIDSDFWVAVMIALAATAAAVWAYAGLAADWRTS